MEIDKSEVSFETPPTEDNFLKEQSQDAYGKTATLQLGSKESEFYLDNRGLLIRKSNADETADIGVPESLRRLFMYLSHRPSISGQQRQRRMYVTLRQTHYWPHIAKEVFLPVAQCASCAQNGRYYSHKRRLQLFRVRTPLKFVGIDILDPLQITLQGNQSVFVITVHYTKLARARQPSKTTATHLANMFFDYWMISFGTPTNLLTNCGH